MNTYRVHVPTWAMAVAMYSSGYSENDARRRFRIAQGFGKRLPAGTRFFLQPEKVTQ